MSLPIADAWFKRERIDDRIHRLWEPHVARVLQCNIWLVRGRDRHLLIDGGMGIRPLMPMVSDQLDKPVTAIATHSHLDHVGAIGEFSDRRTHPLEQASLRKPEDFPVLCSHHWPDGMKAGIQAAGYDVPESMIDALPSIDFDPMNFRTPACDITATLSPGEIIDVGDQSFEVLHLPGHSPGSIGLWDARSGVLFSGDAIYDGPLLDNFPDSDIHQYRRTMERLLTLPVSVVHAGHDPSFDRNRLRALARQYLERTG